MQVLGHSRKCSFVGIACTLQADVCILNRQGAAQTCKQHIHNLIKHAMDSWLSKVVGATASEGFLAYYIWHKLNLDMLQTAFIN